MKLEEVKFTTPCTVPWSDMDGDDRTRLCAACNLNVYNLSAMKREEAEKFLDEVRGPKCIMLWKRPDGTIVTSDCGAQTSRRPRRIEVKGGIKDLPDKPDMDLRDL